MSERGQFSIEDMERLDFDPSAAALLLEEYNNLPTDRSDTLLDFLLAYIDNFQVDEDMSPRENMTAMGVNEAMQNSILDPEIAQFTDDGRDWYITPKNFVDGRMECIKFFREEEEEKRKKRDEKVSMNVDVKKLDKRNVVAKVNFNGPAPKVWHGCLVVNFEEDEEDEEVERAKL